MILDTKIRYLQIAFNDDIDLVRRVLPTIMPSRRILIEAGTPYLKREGMRGIFEIRKHWLGQIVADLKIADGAVDEAIMAWEAGATAATVLGNSPLETLNLFIETCDRYNMVSMIDMLGVRDPLKVLLPLAKPPQVVILHRGRDEENTRGKMIQYKHVSRIRSKYDIIISAAGGVTLREARSAIFNGANIVVANLVRPGAGWKGISTDTDVGMLAREFLETIE